jgi:hypothetical protein
MIDGHFKFYKHVNDDPDFAKAFLDLLFERYIDRSKKGQLKSTIFRRRIGYCIIITGR